MSAYLMTRGIAKKLDYRFLGASPRQPWWAPLADVVVLERPAVIVRGSRDGAAVLISGIPSVRRDAIGTAIRFTLVIDDPDPALLDCLVRAVLDPESRAKLGARLDAAFPAEYVDSALSGHDAGAATVDARLAEALGADATDEPVGRPIQLPDASWMWSTEHPDAVVAFRQRVAQLAAGAPGWAFTTAALSSEDGVRQAIEPLHLPVAVLVDEDGPNRMVDLGKERPGVRPVDRTPGLPRTPILVGVVALLVILLVAAAVVMLR